MGFYYRNWTSNKATSNKILPPGRKQSIGKDRSSYPSVHYFVEAAREQSSLLNYFLPSFRIATLSSHTPDGDVPNICARAQRLDEGLPTGIRDLTTGFQIKISENFGSMILPLTSSSEKFPHFWWKATR